MINLAKHPENTGAAMGALASFTVCGELTTPAQMEGTLHVTLGSHLGQHTVDPGAQGLVS